jgi:hypothetical protein
LKLKEQRVVHTLQLASPGKDERTDDLPGPSAQSEIISGVGGEATISSQDVFSSDLAVIS